MDWKLIKEYKKSESVKLSKNFSSSEFHCHCRSKKCNVTYIDSDLIDYLQEKREMLGKPFKVLSGFRCTTHNKSVGGKPGSQHLQGKAADIKLSGSDITNSNYVSFFKDADGLGIYKGRFLHIDTRGYRARWAG